MVRSPSELRDASDNPVLHTVVASTSKYGRRRTRVVSDNYMPLQNRNVAKKNKAKRETGQSK